MGPKGTIIHDPDFGNAIVRATDETTTVVSGRALNIFAGIGGSADVNVWNTDSTMLFLQDNGGLGNIYSFNPVTMETRKIFPSWRPSAVVFSRLDPNIAFVFASGKVLRFDLSDRSTTAPPVATVVCDFTPLLPSAITWAALGGVEGADTMFTSAFSVAGSQGTGVYACAYCVGKGYRIFNTATGVITGDFGATGTIAAADRFTIHNLKSAKDGVNMVIATTKHPAGTGVPPFMWQIDSLNITPMNGDGHWTAGYGEFFDGRSNQTIPWQSQRRLGFADGLSTRVANPTPKITGPLDGHLSYNGPQGSMLVNITASTGHWPVFPGPWYDEILGFDLNGSGKVYRFCHTFSSGKGDFYSANAIGAVDQLNKFIAFTSDWMGTLLNGRADVFIVALK